MGRREIGLDKVGKYLKMDSRALIEHSPSMRWIFDYVSAATVSRALGTMEIIAALMIAAYPRYPRVAAAGSAMAVVVFTGTLSFLFPPPGIFGDAWRRSAPSRD
ncbi:integral membrane protein [Mycobacteroides abscessus subsp. bolletii]|nr:integral membrane protein [Mycobacteroides abscessus subsp. bolletii]